MIMKKIQLRVQWNTHDTAPEGVVRSFTLQSQLACLANPTCSRQVGNMRLHGPRRPSVRHTPQHRPKRLLLAAHSPFHLAPCRARVTHRLYPQHVYVESQ